MAVAYISEKLAESTGAGTPLAVDKPDSLSVGDLMVAFLYGCRNVGDWATLSGWTKIGSSNTTAGSDANLTVEAKVATSDDVAASTFTFTPHASHEEKKIVLCRITGNFAPGIAALVTSEFNNDATQTVGSGVTPIAPTSLLLIAKSTPHSTTANSGYAVANNNPGTWTERADSFVNTAVDLAYVLATASYASSGITGAYSFAVNEQGGACLISVSEGADISTSPAVLSVIATVQEPTVTGGASVTADTVSAVASVQAPTVSSLTPDWTNTDKNSSSWTNQNKS